MFGPIRITSQPVRNVLSIYALLSDEKEMEPFLFTFHRDELKEGVIQLISQRETLHWLYCPFREQQWLCEVIER